MRNDPRAVPARHDARRPVGLWLPGPPPGGGTRLECDTGRSARWVALAPLEMGAFMDAMTPEECAILGNWSGPVMGVAFRPEVRDPGPPRDVYGAVVMVDRPPVGGSPIRGEPAHDYQPRRPGEAGFFGRCLCLVSFCVRPELRGRGVGSRLMDWAKLWAGSAARCPIVADCYASCRTAPEVLLTYGFRKTYRIPGTNAEADPVDRWEWRGDGPTYAGPDLPEHMRAPGEFRRFVLGWPVAEVYTSAVLGLAERIREDDAGDRLPVLADALEDGGAPYAEALAAFRTGDGWTEGARHYFGCLFGF